MLGARRPAHSARTARKPQQRRRQAPVLEEDKQLRREKESLPGSRRHRIHHGRERSRISNSRMITRLKDFRCSSFVVSHCLFNVVVYRLSVAFDQCWVLFFRKAAFQPLPKASF